MTSINELFKSQNSIIIRGIGRDDITYIPLNVSANSQTISGVFKKRPSEANIGLTYKETETYVLRVNASDVTSFNKADRFTIDSITYSVVRIYNNGTDFLNIELKRVI